ncbi:hypothetical protein PF005_g7836 [Phytophthora fragariae]|uniref:Secreted protein n=1 Tax=Phytophthora fragariae TaxID=53985 RepID=A0A6A4ABT0_9STRA|nr:hypothetical protein PF003_g7377 [Phytophthora fragariae]KAE8941617.1 hypothetical protein PF009_g8594 [Phytophthora fragariae]KAE9017060.1 hypothetical protein PF011_g6866 [Phytophthora fragariae]KAE9115610.1 hypothetical protein PF010_g9260 [Phytophthora fragariae]KAE9119735.1 hypothetical protein PF007_g8438 [Phytophthora fragariae]
MRYLLLSWRCRFLITLLPAQYQAEASHPTPPAPRYCQVLKYVPSSSRKDLSVVTTARFAIECASTALQMAPRPSCATNHPDYLTEMTTTRCAENGSIGSFGFASKARGHGANTSCCPIQGNGE